jgi:hypothetical protein
MGNRTSDFIALAAILGGAGLGLGLTSLVAGTATVARADDASVEVHVVPSRVLVRDGSGAPAIYFRSRARSRRRWAPSERLRVYEEAQGRFGRDHVDRLRSNVELEKLRRVQQEIKGFDHERVERLRARVAEFRLEAREMADFEALFEALEGVEALEDLDLETLTIDLRRDEEDQRLTGGDAVHAGKPRSTGAAMEVRPASA